jgi:hypothetical protein
MGEREWLTPLARVEGPMGWLSVQVELWHGRLFWVLLVMLKFKWITCTETILAFSSAIICQTVSLM